METQSRKRRANNYDDACTTGNSTTRVQKSLAIDSSSSAVGALATGRSRPVRRNRSRRALRPLSSSGSEIDSRCSKKIEIEDIKVESIKVDSSKKIEIEIEGSGAPHVPQHFYEVLDGIREMRRHRDAPVDIMGCDKFGLDPLLTPPVQRYHKLIACMLSSQTRDEANAACMGRLKEFGLDIPHVLETKEEDLAAIIRGVSFHNTKAKNIKKVAHILRDAYEDDIPSTLKHLCDLPGVGPKMAHLVLTSAWGAVEGIPVDIHVHRITNRLGWVDTKAPEKTMKELHSFVPRSLWSEINPLLVGFGQQHCRPVNPKCDSCLVKHICNHGRQKPLKIIPKRQAKSKEGHDGQEEGKHDGKFDLNQFSFQNSP